MTPRVRAARRCTAQFTAEADAAAASSVGAESPRTNRRGTATVELAICLPVLAALIFGAIEACGMIYTTQSLEIAAYESVRMAIRATAYQRAEGEPNVMTNAQVESHAQNVLAERGIVNAVVDIDADDLPSVQAGEVVTITITAGALENSLLPAWFWGDVDIRAQAAMVKEVN